MTAIKKLRDKLLFESKTAGKEQKRDIAEGDAYQSIQEVRVEAILKVNTEIGLRKNEENVQQFRDEWEKCSRVQWHSVENKSCLQQQRTKLEDVIDELWQLMKIPKKRYSRIKQEDHCKVEWRVKNDEGKDNGVLQHKVWQPRRLQPKKNEDSEAYGQQQTKVWEPRRCGLKMHNQELMSSFYFGSMMRENYISIPSD